MTQAVNGTHLKDPTNRHLDSTSNGENKNHTKLNGENGAIKPKGRALPKEVTGENIDDFLSKYDTVLMDCDGVIWKTDHHTDIPGVVEAIKKIRDMGKRILFVSNNSIYSRQTYAMKLRKHKIEVDPEDIFCVSYAAAVYLKKVRKITSDIYVIGTEMIETELNLAGLNNFGACPDPDPPFDSLEAIRGLEFRKNVGVVLVGIDAHFNMNKMCKAATYLVNPDCLFVATDDTEKSIVIPPKICAPIAGSIVDAVKSAAKRDPIVLGKPHALLFECIQTAYPSVRPERTVMIGDTLKTDIHFAHTVGIDSALVLTGMTSFKKMKENVDEQPTYFMQSLAVLADAS